MPSNEWNRRIISARAAARTYTNVQATEPGYVPKGYLGLQQALTLVGNHLFGAGWTGYEALSEGDRWRQITAKRVSVKNSPVPRRATLRAPEQEASRQEARKYIAAIDDRRARAVGWLTDRLYARDLTAYTINERADPQPIPNHVWFKAQPIFESWKWGASAFEHMEWVFVRASDLDRVIGEHPEARAKTPPTAPSTAGAHAKCRTWLLSLAESGPQTLPKARYWLEAETKFPGLSRRSFNKGWSDAVEANRTQWGLSGRRKWSAVSNPTAG